MVKKKLLKLKEAWYLVAYLTKQNHFEMWNVNVAFCRLTLCRWCQNAENSDTTNRTSSQQDVAGLSNLNNRVCLIRDDVIAKQKKQPGCVSSLERVTLFIAYAVAVKFNRQ